MRTLPLAAALALTATTARAETLAVPAGAAPIAIPGNRVACGTPSGGWTTDATHRTLRPPPQGSPGARIELAVAATEAACATASQKVTLAITAPWPVIERAVLSLDDGQLELRGKRLAGVQARWARTAHTGVASCEAIEPDGTVEVCHVATTGDARALWSWLPAGARGEPGELVFDGDGRIAAAETLALPIDHTELAMIARPDAVIDAFATGATVPLRHADLIAAVDCAPAACVLDGDGLLVSNLPAGSPNLSVRVRLAPRVVLRRGNSVESSPVVRIPIVRCPLAVASGAPLRGVEAQTVVVQVGGRCARELDHLRFQVAGAPAERGRESANGSVAYVALRITRTDADAISIAALSEQGDGAIAQVRVSTRPAPPVHVALELGRKTVDFIPTNVAARARVTAADWDGKAELAPIEGVYTVDHGTVRGVSASGGVVAMRVVLRRHLPSGDVDLATVTEPIERPLREATSFAPLFGKQPIVELLCDDGDGAAAIAPGATAHVPFDHNDSCRLVLHRERLDPALGAQKLMLEVDVTRVDGSPRSEARVAKRLRLVHDDSPRTLWLRGAESRFDRYTVRLSQDDDERQHDEELPSAQWSVVTGTGRARIYATSAIPTGLYRVADRDHSGILTLNFGVLARATWLDSLGREGILCAEAGALTVGLANDTSATGKSLTQVATVMGLGLSVPIANRALAAETSVNLHAWLELEPSRAFGSGSGSAWAFVFGPSITVGNLGADL
ncbi:MAG: hypothetical protein ACM31C_26235 [Acidobacteriota bacterium]